MTKKSNFNKKPKNEANLTNKKKKIVITFGVLVLITLATYFLFDFSSESISNTDQIPLKSDSAPAYEFKKEGELTFRSKDDNFISRIDIEIAGDNSEQATGLMYRDKMKEKEGMFFIFSREELQSFWMKNTFLPLDIIFVNKAGLIIKIHKNTQPLSEQSYPSNSPAIYVVEVNAGYTEKFNINEGDKIIWRRF